MSTKLKELRDGCFAKALDNEPMFVLLARDPSAPDLVEKWARQRGEEIKQGKRPASDMAQIAEAFDCANKMREWRTDNDGIWRDGLFADRDIETTAMVEINNFYDANGNHQTSKLKHCIRRESDEYVCNCGVRWGTDEGDEHP